MLIAGLPVLATLQAVPPNTTPLAVAAYVAGLLLSVPVIVAMVKTIFFIATATNKLDRVVKDLASLVKQMAEYRHDKNDQLQAVELSLVVLETDINALQEKTGLPVRNYPDRRSGVDRRGT